MTPEVTSPRPAPGHHPSQGTQGGHGPAPVPVAPDHGDGLARRTTEHEPVDVLAVLLDDPLDHRTCCHVPDLLSAPRATYGVRAPQWWILPE